MKRDNVGRIIAILSLFTVITVQGQTLVLDSATPIKSTTAGGNNDLGRSVAYDQSGNYYVTGSLNGVVDFDPNTAGTQGPASILSNGQAFLAKYDSSGVFQWYKLLSGGSASYGGQVTTSADGVIVTHLYDDGANYKVVVSKYDFTGVLTWSNTLNMSGTTNRSNSLKTDSSGNIYVAGVFANTVDFDPSAGTANLSGTGGSTYPSGFVAKYNGSGAYQWVFGILGNTATNGTNYESGMSNFKMAISGNNLFLTGRFVGSGIDFDPSSGTNTLSMNGTTLGPIFVAKYDLSQTPSSTTFFQWVFQPQGAFTNLSSSYSARFSMPSDIDVDSQGYIYTVGQYILTSGAADFDPGASTTATMTTGTSMKVYVASYDATLTPTTSGFYRWGFTRSGSSSNVTSASAPNYSANYIGSIACSASGDFYLGGSFGGSNVNFNPLCSATPVLISGSSVDMYVARYTNSGICLWANSFATGSDGLNNGFSSLATGNGKLYATGMYKSSAGIDFDPGTGSTSTTSFSTGTDVILLKYSEPTAITIGSIVHPTCSVATGSFVIANYNAAYTYSVSPSTGVSISGATITAPSGTYTVSVTQGPCSAVVSYTSPTVTLNPQPSNTWNGTSWSTGSPPTSSQRIIFAGDFSSTADLTGCSCQVNSGNVVINTAHTLSVVNEVTVSGGSLTFEDDASLVQTNNASTNTGNITYKRDTTALKQYDYTYWSSPVAGAALSQLATNSLFYSFNPTINNWEYQTGGVAMLSGVGYIGRAPSNLTYAPTQIVQTSFVGVPNNGVVTVPILKSTGTYNLIGNPYPSAIDIDLFITANTSSTNGTIYLWTHNTPITGNQYTTNDYAKYNLTGSVRTATSAISGGALPTGKVAAGQGFFIEAKTSLANGTYSAAFNNSMRISGNNTQFYRSNQPGVITNSVSENLERHRIWLSLTNTEGAYSQMLVGYVENATDGFDSLFDGKTMPAGNAVMIYTKVGADNLAIQGKALPFLNTDIVPISYSSTLNGDFAISLENFDGLFENQDIYLVDKVTTTVHDLKTGSYNFVTTNGTFEDRFELHFVNTALGVTNPEAALTNIKIVSSNHQLQVISPGAVISEVAVFDVLGKLLYSQRDINENLFQTTSLNLAPQILLVKVTLENQISIVKKTVVE
jgi:hypothetical protein